MARVDYADEDSSVVSPPSALLHVRPSCPQGYRGQPLKPSGFARDIERERD